MSILDCHVRGSSPLFARLIVTAFLGVVALERAPLDMHAQASARPSAEAQAPPTSNVTFDVASIKRNKQAEAEKQATPPYVPVVPGRAQTLPGGLLRGRGMTVRELIRDAYGYRNRARSEIVGAPKWIDEERYDVEARVSQEFPASTSMGLPPAGEAAMRALLAQRFNLKVHMESRRRPIFELVLHRADGRLGKNMTPSKGGCRTFFQRESIYGGLVQLDPAGGDQQPAAPCKFYVDSTEILAENMTMNDWVRILALRPQLDRTVIDRTGLPGSFDITLRFFEGNDLAAATVLPPIKPLLESQLGLTLREAEGPVEILVIENVEHPTEN